MVEKGYSLCGFESPDGLLSELSSIVTGHPRQSWINRANSPRFGKVNHAAPSNTREGRDGPLG